MVGGAFGEIHVIFNIAPTRFIIGTSLNLHSHSYFYCSSEEFDNDFTSLG